MTQHEDRERVQTCLGVNMVVEAGAGTGKTTLLIDRLCLCVLAQQTPVEKLVALTFTDKAAAEIKTRFILKLQRLVQAVRNLAEDRTLDLLRTHFNLADADIVARAENALARLDRASMGTIHGFCAEILKTFPLEAGLSPNAQIDTGQEAQQLFDTRWNRFLDVELGTWAPQADRWKTVLADISLPELKEFAQELARIKPVEYDYFSHAGMLARLCVGKAARAQQLYACYVPDGKKPRALEKALHWAELSLQRTAAFLKQEPLPPAPPEECPAIPTGVYKDWDAPDAEEAKTIIHFAQTVTPEKQTLFLTAYQLLRPLAQTVQQDCQAEGVLSFDDLIIKTRNLLQKNLYVRRLLKEKFDALFIDEFQDTDPVQGELLLFLAEEKSGTAARWQDVRLQPGKLFVVGDPKQSIYRFRGADITAYELFTRLILEQGGEKCFLRRNFRSMSEIIETANQVCSRAMVQETAFQPAYEPIFTPNTVHTQAVQWLFIRPDSTQTAQADDYRQNQAERIAQWITEQVGTLQLADGRLLTLADIAILTRAGTSLHFYTDALRRHGIAFNTETDKDFFRKQEINDFILFLRAVADPTDSIAVAGVLRSPLGGLTDEELFQVARQGFQVTNLANHPKASFTAGLIQQFAQLAGRVSLQTLVHRILTETFLPEACAAAYDGERTLAYLQQFTHWAAQYEATAEGGLVAFVTELQRRLAEQPEELGLPALDEAQEAVSLLTIHKAKGLEFPVVILADVSRKEVSPSVKPPAHLFSWQHEMYGLRAGKINDVNLAFLEEEQKKHGRCEEIRILYVALTRAKEKLLLIADGRTGAKTALPFQAAGLLPDGNQPSLSIPEAGLTLPVQAYPYCPPKDFIYNQPSTRAPAAPQAETDLASWHQQFQARQAAYQALRQEPQTPSALEDTPLLSPQQHLGAELGTICHRALELLLTQQAADAAAACTQAAQHAGAPARQEEAAALLVPFTQSALFERIRACKLLACEMPFSLLRPDGTLQKGIMDAVLETPAGEIWVVDYKTDQVSPGQEQTLFEQKYRLQLQAYQQAAQKIFPQKVLRCTAVFIRTFAAVEL